MDAISFDGVTCKHVQGCQLWKYVCPSSECALSPQGFPVHIMN
jgi:hypothetical protein